MFSNNPFRIQCENLGCRLNNLVLNGLQIKRLDCKIASVHLVGLGQAVDSSGHLYSVLPAH